MFHAIIWFYTHRHKHKLYNHRNKIFRKMSRTKGSDSLKMLHAYFTKTCVWHFKRGLCWKNAYNIFLNILLWCLQNFKTQLLCIMNCKNTYRLYKVICFQGSRDQKLFLKILALYTFQFLVVINTNTWGKMILFLKGLFHCVRTLSALW